MPPNCRVQVLWVLAATLAAVSCAGCGSEKDLESGIQLKRGARLRIIDLTGTGGEATANGKPIPVFDVEKGIAWYSLMPPKATKIVFKPDVATEIALEPDRDYTVTLGPGSVSTFETDPVKPDSGGPVVCVLNAASKSVAISEPTGPGSVSSGQSSKAVAFDGKVEANGTTASRSEVQRDGIYAAIFFTKQGKLSGRVVWTNPPMSVAGATQGR